MPALMTSTTPARACRVALGAVLAGLLVALMPPSPAWSHPQAQTQAQREAIASQRAQVQAEHAQRVRECQTRFAVTACMEDAERRNRDALADLRRQQMAIDDEQRRLKGAQRIRQIEERAAARTREPAAAPAWGQPQAATAPSGAGAPLTAARPDAGAAPAQPATRRAPTIQSSQDERSRQARRVREQQQQQMAAQQRRQQFEQRERDARERQAKAQARQAEKRNKPPVKPLPPPT